MRSHRRFASVVATAICATVSVAVPHRMAAQQPMPSALSARADTVPSQSSGAGWHVEQCMAGLTYGAPLKWAVAYGGGLLYETNTNPDWCALVIGKIGIGGVQASTGIGTSFAPWGSGVMVTANFLRTFSSPLNATPHRNYVGASLHLWPLLAIGGEIGVYSRLGSASGDATSSRRMVAWSAGFGF